MDLVETHNQNSAQKNPIQGDIKNIDFTADIVPLDHLILESLDKGNAKGFKLPAPIKESLKNQNSKPALDAAAQYILNNTNIDQALVHWNHMVIKHQCVNIMAPQLLFSLVVRFPDPSIIEKLVSKKVTVPENVLEKAGESEQKTSSNMVAHSNPNAKTELQSTVLHELKPYVFYQNQFVTYFNSKTDQELVKDYHDEFNMAICMHHFLETHIQLKDILLKKEEGTANLVKNGIKVNDKQSKLTHLYKIFIQSRQNQQQIMKRLNSLRDKLPTVNADNSQNEKLPNKKKNAIQQLKH